MLAESPGRGKAHRPDFLPIGKSPEFRALFKLDAQGR